MKSNVKTIKSLVLFMKSQGVQAFKLTQDGGSIEVQFGNDSSAVTTVLPDADKEEGDRKAELEMLLYSSR